MVYFADDPDPGKAGQGLATCPLVLDILGQEVLDYVPFRAGSHDSLAPEPQTERGH